MLRYLFLFLIGVLVYYSLRTLFGVRRTGGPGRGPSRRLEGQDMVLDPECHTYVVKDRAVIRRVRGTPTYFCSEECARKHEEKAGP